MHLKERETVQAEKTLFMFLHFPNDLKRNADPIGLSITIPLKHYNFKFNVVEWEQNCMEVNKS